MERYFPEPYRFIPPFRSTFWVRLARGMIVRRLRRQQGIVRWQFSGMEHLRSSLVEKAGILLTPNHCRWADPMLVGVLGTQFRQYLYYIASYHLFRQNKFMGWVLNRLGGYSIWREGADRESIKATTNILAAAERPVVLFPEGTWFRQNDRVGPLQEGLSLITRQAARQAENRKIVIHPVGIKYWMLQDPIPAVQERLRSMERRLGWAPQEHLPVIERIEKLGGALVALKEIEYLGAPSGNGRLDDRIRELTTSQVSRLEKQYLGKTFDGWILERIRRLRQQLTRQLLEKAKDPPAAAPIKKSLDDLLFCENLNAHSLEYLRDSPTPERFAETIQRIEETISDAVEVPLTPMGATIRVGPPIDVRAFSTTTGSERRSGSPAPLVQHLRTAIQTIVDALLTEGPPAEWGCPSRREFLARFAPESPGETLAGASPPAASPATVTPTPPATCVTTASVNLSLSSSSSPASTSTSPSSV